MHSEALHLPQPASSHRGSLDQAMTLTRRGAGPAHKAGSFTQCAAPSESRHPQTETCSPRRTMVPGLVRAAWRCSCTCPFGGSHSAINLVVPSHTSCPPLRHAASGDVSAVSTAAEKKEADGRRAKCRARVASDGEANRLRKRLRTSRRAGGRRRGSAVERSRRRRLPREVTAHSQPLRVDLPCAAAILRDPVHEHRGWRARRWCGCFSVSGRRCTSTRRRALGAHRRGGVSLEEAAVGDRPAVCWRARGEAELLQAARREGGVNVCGWA
eukprot:scaffold5584_cov110-Isochrysis_galbana.AAC.7